MAELFCMSYDILYVYLNVFVADVSVQFKGQTMNQDSIVLLIGL
jgi:hypothetical protein